MKPDFEDECNLDDPCGEIISPCGGKKCYPCSGCDTYTCDPFSGQQSSKAKMSIEFRVLFKKIELNQSCVEAGLDL